jgi:Flp pilus assembly pilin Flp
MRQLYEEEGGTTAIEYALIASMMTLALAGILGELREGVDRLFALVAAMSGNALSG